MQQLIPNRLYICRYAYSPNSLFVFEYHKTEYSQYNVDHEDETLYDYMGRGMQISPEVDKDCEYHALSTEGEYSFEILPESFTMDMFLKNKF